MPEEVFSAWVLGALDKITRSLPGRCYCCALDSVGRSTVPGTGFAPTRDLSGQGCRARRYAFASPAAPGGGMSHSFPQRAHSATGNSAMSQPSATEPMVVSFAVTHMALHNNQELTGTVSFYCEQQRHWSCLSTDIEQQHVGFYFSFLVTMAGDWDYCFMQQGWAQINDDFPRTPPVCPEQVGLVHFLFSCTQINKYK